uniref:Protein kinase domain-containing protein n=1 Tax=Mola mola TaxID=94237 RepID=A0A3Q3VX75_MOLML
MSRAQQVVGSDTREAKHQLLVDRAVSRDCETRKTNLCTVVDCLGEGGFGFVTKCLNVKTGEMEAVKINKKDPELLQQAKKEIDILRQLQCLDPDTCNIIKWNGDFCYQDNICLSFELLDQSLYHYIVDREEGLSMADIRPVIQQVATALYHLNSIGIVHGDIKPDNIMVVDRKQQPLKVKLIDFGLAYQVNGESGDSVPAPAYTAPEILLGIACTEAIDMWSLGIVAVEIATARSLFPAEDEYDVLRLIVEYHGQPSDELLDRGENTENFFTKQTSSMKLDDLPKFIDHGWTQCLFMDLVKKMMQVDGNKRIKPLEVLQHPFLTESLHPSPPAATDRISSGAVPDVILESSCDQLAEPENITCRVESPTASPVTVLEENSGVVPSETNDEYRGFFGSLAKWIRETCQHIFPCIGSQRSSSYQVDTENRENSFPKSPPIVTYTETDSDGVKPEVSQQTLSDQLADPENNTCRVESTRASQAAESKSTGGFHSETRAKKKGFFRSLPKCIRDSSRHIFPCDRSHWSSQCQQDRDNIPCKIENPATSLAAVPEKNTGSVQSETSAKNKGFFRRFPKWIRDTCWHIFPFVSSQQSSWCQVNTDNISTRAESTTASPAAVSKNSGDIQLETSVKNKGLFRRLAKWITDTCCHILLRVSNQRSSRC